MAKSTAKEPEPVEDLPAPKDADGGGKTIGGKTGLITAIVTIVVIPLIMILMWEFYMMPSLKKLAKAQANPQAATEEVAAAEKAEEEPDKKEEAGKEGEAAAGESSTYELKDVVANLSGAMRSRYIKVSFTLEGKAKNFPELMKVNEAKLRDATLAVLSDLTIQDLEEPGVKNIVRNSILEAIGQVLHSNAVEQLYFSEFVVQ